MDRDSETVGGVHVCGKSFPGRGNSQYKCPELGVCHVSWRNS